MKDPHPIFYKADFENDMRIIKESRLNELLNERSKNALESSMRLIEDVPIILNDNDKTNLGTLLNPNVEKILEHATDSHFGMGEKTVLDKNVRDGKEIKADKFGPKMIDDLMIQKSWKKVYSNIKEVLKLNNIEANFYKMTIYPAGGHFEKHLDKTQSEDHLGTLLINLPTTHKGGNLCFYKNDKEVFEWNTDKSNKKNELKYVAFHTDYEHSVKDVEDGYRIVLQFDLAKHKRVLDKDGKEIKKARRYSYESESDEDNSKKEKKSRIEDTEGIQDNDSESNVFEENPCRSQDLLLTEENIKEIVKEIKEKEFPVAIPLVHLYRNNCLTAKLLKGDDHNLFQGLCNEGYVPGKDLFLTQIIGKLIIITFYIVSI